MAAVRDPEFARRNPGRPPGLESPPKWDFFNTPFVPCEWFRGGRRSGEIAVGVVAVEKVAMGPACSCVAPRGQVFLNAMVVGLRRRSERRGRRDRQRHERRKIDAEGAKA